MGYGHSLDLRRRIIAAVEAVALAREAGRRFEVSASSAVNLEVMTTMPDITLSELQSRLAAMDVEISMHRPSARRFMPWDTA